MKSKVLALVRYILLIIIIVCIGVLAKRFLDYKKADKANSYVDKVVENAKNEVGEKIEDDGKIKENPRNVKEKKNLKVLKDLQAINPDVKGFLEVPAAHISYPILQASDNDYYLRKDLNEQYSIAGSVFMDAGNSPDITDDNSVFYGHHLEVDSMFTELTNFRKQDFANVTTNREAFITTDQGLREYQIFAAFGVPSTFDYRTLQFANPKDKLAYYNHFKEISEIKVPVREFKDDDQFITMSTCDYDYEDQRLAVIALRIR